MPNKRKKRGKKNERSGKERKRKVKDEGAAKLSRKKKLAFCTCLNFESYNLASGTKASECSTYKSFGQLQLFLAR